CSSSLTTSVLRKVAHEARAGKSNASVLPCSAKRLIQIRLEILDILKPDGEAHAPVEYAKLCALRSVEPLMGSGGGMRDEALGIAEIVADLDDLKRVHEAEGLTLPAFDLEGDHGTTASHLPLGERCLRMIGTPGMEYARCLFAIGEEIGNRRRRIAMPLNTQRQRLQPLEEYPGIERAERRSCML